MAGIFIDVRVLSTLAQEILFAISFFLVVAAWFFVKSSPDWFRSVRAANWPIAHGRVESIHVKAFAEQALGEIAYSYVVEGERYSGYFSQQFATENDAWNTLKPLQAQSVSVRYNSARPHVSAIRCREQSPLFSQARTGFLRSFAGGLVEFILGQHSWQGLAVVASGGWPIIRGKIESAVVAHHREQNGILNFTVHVAEISYSYRVAGEYYSGSFERSFHREGAAQKYTAQWKDKDVLVRYKPQTPEMSVLRMNDQGTLQTASV